MVDILPPGIPPLHLASLTQDQASALRFIYDNTLVDEAQELYLNYISADSGLQRPAVFFGNDDQWRSILRALGFNTRHTRLALKEAFEPILGPMTTQVAVLDRTTYANINPGDQLVITSGPNTAPPGPNYATLAMEVLVNGLIFPAGTFGTAPDPNPFSYNIRGTHGDLSATIIVDEFSREILVDDTVMFINTHEEDYLTKVNNKFVQFGEIQIDKASPNTFQFVDPQNLGSLITFPIEKSFEMDFYDRLDTGIMKVAERPSVTRHKYMPISSTTLAASSLTGALTLTVKDGSVFPAAAVPAPVITAGVTNIIITTGAAAGVYQIDATSANTLTINGGTPLPLGGPLENLHYITFSAPLGFFTSFEGRIINATTFFDASKNFDALADIQRFSVLINRGELNEELLEVESIAANVLTLVTDPESPPSNLTSSIKFDHLENESIELANLTYGSTSSYFILNPGGDTVGAADVGSTDTILNDAGATFLNTLLPVLDGAGHPADGLGDDVEILTDPLGINTGFRRSIIAVAPPTQITVDDQFPSPMAGCTYRIVKRYRAAPTGDNVLYLEDTSGLPAANFPVVLDRGEESEEIVYISANDVDLNTLTVSNNETGTVLVPAPQVATTHDFGMTVEAAQVLLPGCEWHIIETQATGEFTIATRDECVPPINTAWKLHQDFPIEKSQYGAGALGVGADINTGDKIITLANITTDFSLPLENPSYPGAVFNPITITDSAVGGNTEIVFATELFGYTNFAQQAQVGETDIIVYDASEFSDALPAPNILSIDILGALETRTIAVGGIVKNADGTYTITLGLALANEHNVGATVQLQTPIVKLAHPILSTGTPAFAAATTTVLLTYLDSDYRHSSAMLPESSYSASAGTTVDTIFQDGHNLYPSLVGQEIEDILLAVVHPNKRRPIINILGLTSGVTSGHHKAKVEPAFPVPPVVRYKVNSAVQIGDPSAVVGNPKKLAGPIPAKDLFTGSYIYQKVDEFITSVDQPKITKTTLAPSVDPLYPTAMYRIPAPQKMIKFPIIPYGTATGGLTTQLADASIADFTNIFNTAPPVIPVTAVGKILEILEPPESLNYKKKVVVTTAFLSNVVFTPALPEPVIAGMKYRLLSDSNAALSLGGTEFYIDDASLFPVASQNPFSVEIDDPNNPAFKDILEVVGIDNVTGKITLSPVENVLHDYGDGTVVSLMVEAIAVNSILDFPTDGGGFYLDYGFKGNSVTKFPLEVDGIISGVTNLGAGDVALTDDDALFTQYGHPQSLVGYTVRVTTFAPAGIETGVIFNVANNGTLRVSGLTFANLTINDTYHIYNSSTNVDDIEPGTFTVDGTGHAVDSFSRVGGIFTDIISKTPGTTHNARPSSVVEEYVDYKAVDGNVLVLLSPTVFNYAHPTGSEVRVGSGELTTAGDGSDFRPYLAQNFLEVLFNPYISSFYKLFKAAGIEAKTDTKSLGS
jgi:hypothetical protein